MVDIARLGISADSRGVVKATTDLDRLGDKAADTEKRVVSAGRSMTTSMDGVKDSAVAAGDGFSTAAAPMRQMFQQAGGGQHVMRQMSFQLNQMAQSGAANGMWMQAVMVQIPDMLGLFGSLPLVLAGGAAALAGSFLPALIGAGDEAKEFTDNLDELRDALNSYVGAADLAMMSTDELRDRYGAAADGMRSTLDVLEQISRTQAQRKIDAINQSIADMMGADWGGGGDLRGGIADFFDVDIMLAFTDAQRDARAEARQLTGEFLNQQAALDSAAGDLDAQIAVMQNMVQTAQTLADLSGDRSDEELALIQHLAETLQLMQEQRGKVQEVVDSTYTLSDAAFDVVDAVKQIDFSNAIGQAETFAGILREAAGNAWRMAQAKASIESGQFELGMGAAAYGGAQSSMRSATEEFLSEGTVLPDPPKKRTGRSGTSAADKAKREAQQAADAFERLKRSLDPLAAINGEYADNQKILNDALAAGKITAVDFAVGMAMVDEAHQKAMDDLEGSTDRLQNLQDGVAGFTDALFDNSTSISDWAANALIEFAKVQAQLALLKAFGISTDGVDASSTFIGSIIDGFRAGGGPVSANRAYVVGEKGPELMVPQTSGVVVPNHQLGGQGAQPQFTSGELFLSDNGSIMGRVRYEQAQGLAAAGAAQRRQFGSTANTFRERGTTG
ncbi:hypothetical protein CLG85_001675 [Yangia mangrovi]|nr:hypothetical protein [Alloyangia mangrovi]MCT4369119.1 hypothetical protein [Alloyangia mangrovi]